MKVETWIFTGFAIFFAPVGVVYGIITNWKEPLGPPGLFLTSGMCALIAAFLFITGRRIDPRPEDNPDAQVADGAGDLGQHFPPYSWTPLWGGAAAALTFMGMAVGWWMLLIGIVVGLLAAFLWVFEYYRGENAH